jgi:hypothetical protein
MFKQPQNRVTHVSPLRHGSEEPQSLSPTRNIGPQLVPPPRPRRSPLALWHLLSLDAPTVAALWTIFIARCSHLTLPWTVPAAMFVAVWMIYAADRLLDARLLDTRVLNTPPLESRPFESRNLESRLFESRISPPDLEPRHRFHHHHRTLFLAFILLSAFTLAGLLHHIDPRALHLYVLLATLLAAWMLLIHIRPQPNGTTRRLPKELAVGIFFPAAIFIPTLARTNATPTALHLLGWTANWLRPNLLPSAILFACVCTLNCLCLYAWEHPAKPLQDQTARTQDPATPIQDQSPRLQAHWTTRWATAHLTQLALSLLAASTIATLSLSPPIALPALACSLSTAALFALNLYRRRLSPIHLRAAADLVLLTPLLLLPLAR